MRKVAWRDDRPAERPARATEGKAAQDAVSGNGERQVAWKNPPIDPNRKRAWKDAPEETEKKKTGRDHPDGTGAAQKHADGKHAAQKHTDGKHAAQKPAGGKHEARAEKQSRPGHTGKKRRKHLLIAGILFGVIALAGLSVFVKELQAYRKAADYYERLSAFVERDLEPPQSTTAGDGAGTENGAGAEDGTGTQSGGTSGSRFGKVRGSRLDFSNLRRMNPDVAGWLSIPQISFSGPVVWCGNNTTYLDKGFDWTESRNGCPFLAADAASDFSLPYSLIYGRNMHNGTMFGNLDRYRKKSFFEKHPTFLLYTPRQDYECAVFSCYKTEDASEVYRMDWKDAGEYSAFLERIKAASVYDTGVNVFPGDKVLTLSTCGSAYTGGKDRFVVHAVMRRVE